MSSVAPTSTSAPKPSGACLPDGRLDRVTFPSPATVKSGFSNIKVINELAAARTTITTQKATIDTPQSNNAMMASRVAMSP
jgi:hypothetical protein